MKPTHELIDPDEPRCLYCNSSCNIELRGQSISKTRYDIEILTCQKCQSIFEIYSVQDLITSETTMKAFAFTCKDLCVNHDYSTNQFIIGDHNNLYDNLDKYIKNKDSFTSLPAFDVDFSDKEKLWKKLETYLVFS